MESKKKEEKAEKEHEELLKKAKLSDEYYDRLLRLQAEFDNYKKRAAKERLEFSKFANEDMIYDLLPIVDDFERALYSAKGSESFELLHKGVEIILAHLHELLAKRGLSRVSTVGTDFDPAMHEAVAEIETEDYPENTIVEELQAGYLLHGKVIRPAKVKVAKRVGSRPE